MFRRRMWILLAVAGLTGNWSCGGKKTDANRLPVYPVKGTITYQSKPVQDAHITFNPVGQGKGAFGRTDKDGHYRLRTYEEGDGAVAGEYIVTVMKVVDQNASQQPVTDTMAPQPRPRLVSMVPGNYSRVERSTLRATVKPVSNNSLDFKLD